AAMAPLPFSGPGRQNAGSFANGGGPAAFGAFSVDTKVTPASRSLGVDISIMFYAACVFMVIEARKLGVRFVWAYVILGLLVAISVTFPLFLIARERRLASGAAAGGPGSAEPGTADVVGLRLLACVALP